MEQKVQTPEVGMGVTIATGSDYTPGTIVKVSPSGKTIEYTEDECMRTDGRGLTEDQDYVFLTQEDGARYTARWSAKYGRYRTAGGRGVAIGFRRKFRDPSF